MQLRWTRNESSKSDRFPTGPEFIASSRAKTWWRHSTHICSEDPKLSEENWTMQRKQHRHYRCNKTGSCGIKPYIINQANNWLQSLIFLSLWRFVSDELSCQLFKLPRRSIFIIKKQRPLLNRLLTQISNVTAHSHSWQTCLRASEVQPWSWRHAFHC